MKVRYMLSGSLITIIIILLIGILSVNINRNEVIYVKDVAGYTKLITDYNKKIDKLKNKECKNSINDLLTIINNTHFTEDTTVKEYYNKINSNDNFLVKFSDLKETCNLSDDDFDSIYVIALSSTNFPNHIKEKYLSSYEFNIKDTFSRSLYSKDIDEVGTYTTTVLELKVIDELLEVVK